MVADQDEDEVFELYLAEFLDLSLPPHATAGAPTGSASLTLPD